jgi:hypothetical protein
MVVEGKRKSSRDEVVEDNAGIAVVCDKLDALNAFLGDVLPG